MAPSSQLQRNEKRSAWYALVIFAAICFGVAWYSYSETTALEASGGSIKIPAFLRVPYEVVGRWGLVGVLGAIGLYSLVLGVRRFGARSQGRAPSAFEDPEWARRMRDEALPAREPVPARRRH